MTRRGVEGGAVTLALSFADQLDRWEARLRAVSEHLGWPQRWLREFRNYLCDPRMSLAEFWVRYTLKRLEAKPILSRPMTADNAQVYTQTTDYLLWRQVVHRRHSAWRRVLVTMRGRRGTLLEYGSGIGPVSAWVSRRKPAWSYTLDDLDSPHWRYGLSRIRPMGTPRADWQGQYDVVTALDVFEHLPDPEAQARRLVSRLAPGGYLHWNFIDATPGGLDLATREQREATLQYVRSVTELVWERDEHTVSRLV